MRTADWSFLQIECLDLAARGIVKTQYVTFRSVLPLSVMSPESRYMFLEQRATETCLKPQASILNEQC